MATNYERGRAFEYRVRDKLKKDGAVYVMRAAQSKGKVDLLALWPLTSIVHRREDGFPEWQKGYPNCVPWIVQCKRDGRLPAAERAELLDIAAQTGALPVLAKTGPNGRGVEFLFLNEGVK